MLYVCVIVLSSKYYVIEYIYIVNYALRACYNGDIRNVYKLSILYCEIVPKTFFIV